MTQTMSLKKQDLRILVNIKNNYVIIKHCIKLLPVDFTWQCM